MADPRASALRRWPVNHEAATVIAEPLLTEDLEEAGAHVRRLAPADSALLIERLKEARMPLLNRRTHLAIVVAILVVGALTISSMSASATASRTWYWTVPQAQRAIIAKVKIPYCRILPADAQCATKLPFRPTEATCRGFVAKPRSSTRFHRFTCDYIFKNDIGGDQHLTLYVTGRFTFRWKTI